MQMNPLGPIVAEPVPESERPKMVTKKMLIEGAPYAMLVECPLCHDLLWDAVLCGSCLEAYCSACLIQHLAQSNGLCPCQQPFVKRSVTKRWTELLEKLRFQCPNKGCSQILAYSQAVGHSRLCPYDELPCPNAQCETKVLRKDIEDHLKGACQYENVKCKYCSQPQQRHELPKHEGVCPKKPVPCEDCGCSLLQENVDAHMQECPQHPVTCHKCELTISRGAFSQHNCFEELRKMCKQANEDVKQNGAARSQLPPSALQLLARELELGVCPDCKRLAQKGTMYECSLCAKKVCSGRCLYYCRKCTTTLMCNRCRTYCPNCCVPLCPACQRLPFAHCNWLHFFFFEPDKGVCMYIYNHKMVQGKATKLDYPETQAASIDSALVDRTIYLTGGKVPNTDNGYTQKALGLDVEESFVCTPRVLQNMIVGKCYHRLVAVTTKELYSIGGFNASGPLTTCEVFTISKNRWQETSSLNEPRQCPTVVTTPHSIYAIGSASTHEFTMEELEIEDAIWTPVNVTGSETWQHLGHGVGLQIAPQQLLLFEQDGHVYKYDCKTKTIASETTEGTRANYIQTKPLVYLNSVLLFNNMRGKYSLSIYLLTTRRFKDISWHACFNS